MKKILISSLILLLFSCQSKPFKGIGGFELGTNFNSLPQSKNFEKGIGNQYILRGKFKLSEDVGSVSDLSVTIQNGKIVSVMFSSNENTDISEAEKAFDGLIPDRAEPVKGKYSLISVYRNKDKSIFAVIDVFKDLKLKNGEPQRNYYYSLKKVASAK